MLHLSTWGRRRLGLFMSLIAAGALAGCGGSDPPGVSSLSADSAVGAIRTSWVARGTSGVGNGAGAAGGGPKASNGKGSGSSGGTTEPTGSTSGGTLALSGQPPATATVGSSYSFQPTLSAPAGAVVTYSIANRPAWATFSPTNGQLQGTPTAADAGVYSNIVISASDGSGLASLQAFAITVESASAPNSPGTAALTWVAPTTNDDGSPMTDLTIFRIYYGTDSSSLSDYLDVVADGNTRGFVVSGLAPGTYYFEVSAVNSSGVESARSNEVSRSVG